MWFLGGIWTVARLFYWLCCLLRLIILNLDPICNDGFSVSMWYQFLCMFSDLAKAPALLGIMHSNVYLWCLILCIAVKLDNISATSAILSYFSCSYLYFCIFFSVGEVLSSFSRSIHNNCFSCYKIFLFNSFTFARNWLFLILVPSIGCCKFIIERKKEKPGKEKYETKK